MSTSTPSRRRSNSKGAAAACDAQPTPAQACVGLVTACDAKGFQVSSGGLRARGRRAASCLLAPAAGDTVACLLVAPDEVWITAVLQREEGVCNELRLAGDTRIVVDGGALELDAARLGLRSEQLDIATQRTSFTTDSAEVVGRQFNLIGTGIRVVGSLFSSVMDRVQHYSRHYLRTTDGIDRVAATHVECEAKQLMRIEGEHTLVNGRELVKARGAQIHFG